MSVAAREAGSTAGAVFLQQFVGDMPWAHLDIAATAWTSRDLPLAGKGATGYGVRLLDRLVASALRKRGLTEIGFYHLTRSSLEDGAAEAAGEGLRCRQRALLCAAATPSGSSC